MKSEYTYWMAFASADNVFTKRKNEILVMMFKRNLSISDFFSLSDSWKEDFNLSEDEISIFLSEKEKLNNYSFVVEDLMEQGYQLVPIFSEQYPKHLKETLKYQSPVLLYAFGNTELLNYKSVAIVGCRKASQKSLLFTDNIARKCVKDGFVVVSGFAKGVDRQALDSAIQNGGCSIVVLPQGITTFGTGFRSLYREISSGKVVVISAFRPNAGWDKGLAMARNPYIYGLAEKIFVAESDSKGGTYSGVQDGLRKNREIYVRHAEASELNANNILIAQGAKPVDMEGNLLESVEEEKSNAVGSIEDKIREILGTGEYTAKDLAKRLYCDDSTKFTAKVRTMLKQMGIKPVNEKKSPLKYTIQPPESQLF